MKLIRDVLGLAGIDVSVFELIESHLYIKVGILVVALSLGLSLVFASQKNLPNAVAVLPTSSDFHHAKLVQKVHLSHNTALYRFQIPHPVGHMPGLSPEPILGLPIGQHISLTAEINGKEIQRKYTPTTLDGEDPGHFHLVVKVSSGFPVVIS
jgi:cytochrome-b5 reductase